MISRTTHITTIVWVVLTFLGILAIPVQAQTPGFSGSDPDNYTCPLLADYGTPRLDPNTFLCHYPSAGKGILVTNASLKPPTIKVLQYWFMRILYGAWAGSGIVFTLIMVWLGFQYMTSRGDPGKIGEVRKRIKNWFIGLLLIFLSYPVLNTLFNILGVSQTECFSNINMPGFQFFFPTACGSGTGGTGGPNN